MLKLLINEEERKPKAEKVKRHMAGSLEWTTTAVPSTDFLS